MKRILVVDDSLFAQKNIIRSLKNCGKELEIYTASDGREAFEKYIELRPDIIVVDLLMPEINGIELSKMIKARIPEAIIVVLTADIQNKVKSEALEAGVNLFINKPINDAKACQIMDLLKDN